MDTQVISINFPKAKIISIFVTALIIFSAAIIIWQQQGLDNAIVIQHNFIYQNAFLLNFFQFITDYGMGFIALLYGILAYLSFKFEDLASNRPLLPLILFGFAFGSIAGDLLKEVFNRARPALALAGQIATTVNSSSPAFPSGHATKSLALALPFVIIATGKNLKTKTIKTIVLISAILVSYSRIALQRHYLSDVLGALGVALFFVPVSYWFVNYIYKSNQLDQAGIDLMARRIGFVFIPLSVVLCLL